MNSPGYREAFDRIRAEFSEMPGMRRTSRQVERLSGVDRAVCQCVLDDLVRARFLNRLSNGDYGKASDTSITDSRSLHGRPQVASGSRTRRAS
jgi:hypothetical protein